MKKARLSKILSPARIIALGFLLVILIGSLLLSLPFSVRDGVQLRYIDALYTSTSAVCVTGLTVVDAHDTFTPIGQFIIGMLIQIGGLGVSAVGAGVILAVGRRVNLKGRSLVREAMNLDSGRGIIRFVKSVFLTTVAFELVGAVLSFIVFIQDHPFTRALGLSLFHAVSSFNNAGFDILGGGQSLATYRDNIPLNLITCGLIFFGGIGFLVIREVIEKRFNFRKLSMHSKVVLTMSAVLTFGGMLLLMLTEKISWIGALFQSVSARTAGFATYSLGDFTNPGLIIMIILMFVGASPGSTGGGIKTSTLFVLIQGIKASATGKSEKAFKYSVPREAFRKAAVIVLIGIAVVLTGTYIVTVLEPELSLRDVMFEMTSAFSTAGLSTGITGGLGIGSKILSIIIMYIGRLGPLTIASLWYFTPGERTSFPDGNIVVG